MPGEKLLKPSLFQSTPSCGGRQGICCSGIPLPIVSIHALLRRATQRYFLSPKACAGFNPRPPAEGDGLRSAPHSRPSAVSIHALLRRATVVSIIGRVLLPRFNPRPPAEGDFQGRVRCNCLRPVSIHALLRRATIRWCDLVHLVQVSIHALLRRATPFPSFKVFLRRDVSIHALLRRATS